LFLVLVASPFHIAENKLWKTDGGMTFEELIIGVPKIDHVNCSSWCTDVAKHLPTVITLVLMFAIDVLPKEKFVVLTAATLNIQALRHVTPCRLENK
jgi:hypothetical protein